MKFFYFLVIGLLCSFVSFSQNLSGSFMFGGQNRTYRINIPSSYNDSLPVPLVLAMHGMGDNATNFQGIGLNQFSNSDNFIAVYPNALVDQLFGASGWNAGVGAFGIFVNGAVDDVGFLNALIDSITKNYSIDSSRIYATGFSIGGYMAQRLACELSDRVAAIASVSGLIGSGVPSCNPSRNVPVMHMHGTADSTITYSGGFNLPGFGTLKVGKSVDEVIAHWKNHNDCNATPDTTSFTKLSYQIEKIDFGMCEDSSELVFYKIFGFPHNWLASQNNPYATEEIWNFFKRHRLIKPDTVSTGIQETASSLSFYPNPVKEVLFLKTRDFQVKELSIINLIGQEVFHKEVHSTVNTDLEIPLNGLNHGVYLLRAVTNNQIVTYKFLKE